MQVQQSNAQTETTDILARKERMFERKELVGVKPTNMENIVGINSGSDIKPVDVASECSILLLEFESVDGCRITARPMTRQILYHNQGNTLKTVVENGTGYITEGHSEAVIGGKGWNIAITPEHEDASRLSRNTDEMVASILSPKSVIKSILQNLQIRLGNRTVPDWDTVSSDAVTGLSKNFSNIGFEGCVNDYINFVSNFSREPFKTTVLEMKGHSRMSVLVGSEKFDLLFDGRPTNGNHVPTMLANRLGVSVPENLQGENIKLGAGQYVFKKTNMNVIGRNNYGTVAIGL